MTLRIESKLCCHLLNLSHDPRERFIRRVGWMVNSRGRGDQTNLCCREMAEKICTSMTYKLELDTHVPERNFCFVFLVKERNFCFVYSTLT